MRCSFHYDWNAVAVTLAYHSGVRAHYEIGIADQACESDIDVGNAGTPSVAEAPIREARPRPVRRPRRAHFILGAVGMAIVLVTYGGWVQSLPPPTWQNRFYGMAYQFWFTIGMLSTGWAFGGYRRNYGSLMGLATQNISTMFFLPSLGVVFLRLSEPLRSLYQVVALVSVVYAGGLFILWGVAMIVVRRFTGHQGVTIAAGVLFIVAGGLWCSLVLQPVGSLLLLPALIVGMVSLALSRVPKA